MTVLWTTTELPGHNWDPDPDEDDEPRRGYPLDLHGQAATHTQLKTMTTIQLEGGYL